MPRKDLVGQQFGQWTVIAEPNKANMWLCECSCGTRSAVAEYALTRGISARCKSCASRQSGSKRRLDLTGQRYGKLVVVRRVGTVYGGKITTWEVQCDCGSPPKVVRGPVLRTGNTRSCGCLRLEMGTKVNLFGKSVNIRTLAGTTGLTGETVLASLRSGVAPENVLLRQARHVAKPLMHLIKMLSPVHVDVLLSQSCMTKRNFTRTLWRLRKAGKVEVKDGVVTLVNGGT